MPVLKFTASVQDVWRALERDPAMAGVVDRLHDALDLLEADPTDPRCRRRRFTPPGVWCIVVRTFADEFAILWEPDTAGNPVVVHIGPATFA